MIDVIPKIQQHFDALQDRMDDVVTYESPCEGWFKGESFVVLSELAQQGTRHGVVREDNAKVRGKRKVDLIVSTVSGLQFIELKHWLIGRQKGQPYSPECYARVRDGGIIGDVEKLALLNQPTHSWLLLLLTVHPGLQQ